MIAVVVIPRRLLHWTKTSRKGVAALIIAVTAVVARDKAVPARDTADETREAAEDSRDCGRSSSIASMRFGFHTLGICCCCCSS